MKKFYLIVCILTLILAVGLGACIPPPEEKIPAIADAIPIDPDKIRAEFEVDRDAARAKWEGKLVSATGTVEDTSEQWKMATLVSGKSIEEGGADIHARIPKIEVIQRLQRGQQITVIGTFHEYMIAAQRVVVVDCYVIE
jgi:hypothetical protein